MGSYGIGVSGMAAVGDPHDDKGIIWPVSVAPYEVVITVVRADDEPPLGPPRGSTRDWRLRVSRSCSMTVRSGPGSSSPMPS